MKSTSIFFSCLINKSDLNLYEFLNSIFSKIKSEMKKKNHLHLD